MKNKWYSYIYLKDQKLLIFLVLFAIGLSSYLGFITPKLIAALYESFKDGAGVDKAIYALVGLFICEYFVGALYQLSINKYVQKLLSFIRNRSFDSWLISIETGKKGQYGEAKYPMGEVLSRILTDTEAVIEMVSTGSFKIFIDFAFIISCLIGLITLNTTSGVALIIAELLACVLLIVGSKKMAAVYMSVRKSTGILSRVIANLAGGFRYTYFHPHHKYASKKGYDAFEDFLNKQLKANFWDAGYFSIAESLFPILLALLVVIFPYSQIVEIAVLAAIIDLIQRSISPIKEIAGKISSIQRARTGIVRIEEFNKDLETMPKSQMEKSFGQLKLKQFEVEIDYFSYPKKETDTKFEIKDVKIQANAGELVGLVGQSGCGKSTILKILSADIVTPKAKLIFTDTNDKKLVFSGEKPEDLLEYKGQVSIVSQDSHVFSSTLRFNISLSYQKSPQFDEFWNMLKLKIAYLEKWGIKLDDKINPKDLSLGQKQLICALRSCYLAKPIVLFDEISSALDSDLEEALKELVLIIQKQSLTIIVAHRIETIVNANKIIVMDKGKVLNSGTHNELLKKSEFYTSFIKKLGSA